MAVRTINSVLERPLARTIGNFIVIWLDSNISEMNESISEVRRAVCSVQTFSEPNPCIDFLKDVKDQKVFFIVSGTLGEIIMPSIHDMPQLDSLYIFCDSKPKHEQWIKEWRKVKGVFTDISSICYQLKRNARQCEQDLMPISIVSESSVIDSNELGQSFMYSQLLKETLLEIEYDDKAKKEFVDFCRLQYSENAFELHLIDEFERDYDLHSPIWWYTKESFIYSMLNRALRTQDIEIIIKMSFFIRDLHRQIEQVHSETHQTTKNIIYRGQGMSNTDFEKLKKNKNGLLSFNNFLSTSIDLQVSLAFAESSGGNPDLTGILFQIEIDPLISSIPFASLDNISYFSDSEKEILFSMHTVFRIGEIKQIEEKLWQVNLALTSDNDEQLRRLTEHIRKDNRAPTGWHRLGQLLMVEMGEFDKAEVIYKTLLKITTDENWRELAYLYHHLGYINNEKGDFTSAHSHYEQSLNIKLSHLPSDHPYLAPTYSNIGVTYWKKGDLEMALKCYQLALTLDLRAPEPDQLNIALRHRNIGVLFDEQGKYAEALKSLEYALEIQLVNLPAYHPTLANTYHSIAGVHQSMKNYPAALSYLEKAVEIQQKSLPSNHPTIALAHYNMSNALYRLERYKEAFEHASQAVDIAQHTFKPNHAQMQMYQRGLDQLRQKL